MSKSELLELVGKHRQNDEVKVRMQGSLWLVTIIHHDRRVSRKRFYTEEAAHRYARACK
jgi:hypothetical protein